MMYQNKYLKYKNKYNMLKNGTNNLKGGNKHTKQATITNDNINLIPVVSRSERILEFDFPEISIASVEYTEGPTGCTYIRFNVDTASYYVDARGGSVMTYASNHARSNNRAVRGICFAGGSYLGLEALSGCVIEELKMVDYVCVSKCNVTGASLRSANLNYNNIYPDKDLGRFAVQSLQKNHVYLGQVGAGCMAGDGRYGQGAAFATYLGIKIFVLTAVNALGVIYDYNGKILRDRREIIKDDDVLDPNSPKNTTLTVVITNLALNAVELEQLSIQCHTNMAVTIRPFHTIGDGDVLFGVTLSQISKKNIEGFNMTKFYELCSETANRAVLNCF
ncbi:endotype 6-aminohexanoat-oligomer hydrolase [Megavirus lba]|uniref:Endotype 6-aminohexanoat-oligomer hydrolase n=1 Tax=Megavirus lba TaxID=1235314 RepID=L7XZF8_9VIRU|nr:endotype 6-aminohexanoat-oligomer hydrolase [Megavirus lba]